MAKIFRRLSAVGVPLSTAFITRRLYYCCRSPAPEQCSFGAGLTLYSYMAVMVADAVKLPSGKPAFSLPIGTA